MQQGNFDTNIEIKFVREGVHRFPRATEPQFATGSWDDVSFLAVPHMHYFHFVVKVQVFHDDRDLEFIQFSRWCQRLYGEGTLTLDYKSCEMMARDLIEKINERYPDRRITVSVYEDNINGATVDFVPSTVS